MEAKIKWKLTWYCCICFNPAKGRVDFEDGWLIKSSFITKDEMKACQLTRTKFPQKKIEIINKEFLSIIFLFLFAGMFGCKFLLELRST
jgi:hypothetical protein